MEDKGTQNIKKAPFWFNLLFYGGIIALTAILGIVFGITAGAVVTLFFSAFFTGYLAVAYTASFKVAKFAKSVAMALGLIGIIMLFISVGWWGIVGIFGYWVSILLSMVFWQKNAKFRI